MPAAARVLLALFALLLCGAAPPDPLEVEFERLVAQAHTRRAEPGAAVDLLRIADLAPWIGADRLDGALKRAARDPKTTPLVQAVAWWLLHGRARDRLAAATATEAQRALGLIDAWVIRTGAAPHPVAPLVAADGWRPAPPGGDGVAWLEASIRPSRNTRATLATRLVAESGPAVIRLGYDDQVKVWLNGDEVYVSPAAHRAWLDQAAVPVRLLAGDNQLRVEVTQTSGAWRLLARVTDAEGRPLPVQAFADPWGPPPDPAEGDAPEEIAHLWADLQRAAEAEGATAQAIRDHVDYARVTGLPDEEMAEPRVLVESAWVADHSPRSLRAWLRILPDAERAAVRSAQHPLRPVTHADHVADLFLRLADGWRHYYARHHREALRVLAELRRDAPTFLPAVRLNAVVWEDLGLPHRAAALVERARAEHPWLAGLDRALLTNLLSGGRTVEAMAALKARVDAGRATTDDHYQLADLLADRGETDAAVALLDAVTSRRPELLVFEMEAAAILRAAERPAEAITRLEALHARVPLDGIVTERLAQLYLANGRADEALPLLRAAAAAAPGDQTLGGLLAALTQAPPAARLGPPLATLAETNSPPDTPAHVLYHHAHAEVGADGRAVRRVRRVIRVVDDEGARRYGEWSLPYVPSTQRLDVEVARLVRPGRPDASPRRSDRDLSEPEYRLYFDLRAEVLTFDRPQPGDLIEVAWRLVDTEVDPSFPGYFGEVAYLQEAVPRAVSVVEVSGPAAAELAVEVVAKGITVLREGGRIEARDVPAVPLEAHMPGASDVQAYVHLSTLKGWGALDTRYQALLADRDQPTPALRALARRWVGDAQGPEAIMARLYERVADRTRYVGLEFGVRSFQPATPAETLARGYGDCKDKATLLIALARSVGVDARLALVRTRSSGRVSPSPASFAIFDHAVVYVPALDRFMDPTVDRNDPWTLPPSDQGAQAFVVGGDAALRRVPRAPADANDASWALAVTLTDDGRAEGTVRWTTTGQPAARVRRTLEGDARAAQVTEALGHLFPGVQVHAPTFDGLRPARDPVAVEAQVRLPAFPRTPTGWAITQGGGPWRLVSGNAQAARRQTTLLFDFHRRRRLRLAVALPPGARVTAPPPVHLKGPFGRLDATATVAAGVLTLDTDLRLDQAEIEPADYPAFRAWLAEVDRVVGRRVEVIR